jgi:peptide-methionine (S)-S-oxide reductase
LLPEGLQLTRPVAVYLEQEAQDQVTNMLFSRKKLEIPSAASALKGRSAPIPTADEHYLFSRPLKGPYPAGTEKALFAMGCFWGAEKKFWELGSGIWITAVGYAAGATPNPTYDEVCTGNTGHTEVVLVVYDPKVISYGMLLKTFWESHNPTQGMRQGNDVGTQYRSGIYTFSEAQREAAEASKADYRKRLLAAGFGPITTEILPAPTFYFAEEHHQQYLAKVPHGYCGLGGTGVACAAPTGVAAGG